MSPSDAPALAPARSDRAVRRRAADALRLARAAGAGGGATVADAGRLDELEAALERAADELTAHLGTDRALPAEAGAVLVELRDAARQVGSLLHAPYEHPACDVQATLGRLEGTRSTSGLLGRLPEELVRTVGVRRVAVSVVDGSSWSIRAVHRLEEGPSTGDARTTLVPLDASRPERLAVRTGEPVVVADAGDPGSGCLRPVVAALGLTSYVVLPVVVSTGVIALVHADHGPAGRPVDGLDSRMLAAAVHAFATVYERAALEERLEGQRRALADALAETVEAADAALNREIALGTTRRPADELVETPTPVGGRNDRIDALLTPREREVLALLVVGAANGAIAERLAISSGTVKSHVKQILRKLGAVNRSEAISIYLSSTADA